MTPPTPPNRLRIEYPANLTASYANGAIINSTFSEIIIDMVQILPNDPRPKVVHRIALTPVNAKLLLTALQDNLAQFEAKNGPITLPPKPPTLADQLFQTARPTPDQNGDPAIPTPDPAQE